MSIYVGLISLIAYRSIEINVNKKFYNWLKNQSSIKSTLGDCSKIKVHSSTEFGFSPISFSLTCPFSDAQAWSQHKAAHDTADASQKAVELMLELAKQEAKGARKLLRWLLHRSEN